jgi:hypothetical protein
MAKYGSEFVRMSYSEISEKLHTIEPPLGTKGLSKPLSQQRVAVICSEAIEKAKTKLGIKGIHSSDVTKKEPSLSSYDLVEDFKKY